VETSPTKYISESSLKEIDYVMMFFFDGNIQSRLAILGSKRSNGNATKSHKSTIRINEKHANSYK
jgi:hypothetical protein